MAPSDLSWTANAGQLEGPGFDRFQVELAKYNGRQLEPGFPNEAWRKELDDYAQIKRAEGELAYEVDGGFLSVTETGVTEGSAFRPISLSASCASWRSWPRTCAATPTAWRC